MQRLEVSRAVRPLEWSLGIKGLKQKRAENMDYLYTICVMILE